MINLVICSGKVAVDPIYGKTDKGKSYCYLKLAVPKTYLGESRNTHTLVQFSSSGKIAENIFNYAKKGDFAEVKGHVDVDSKYKIFLIADRVRVVRQEVNEPINILQGEDFKDLDDYE